jgi:putative membrane protein
MFHGYYGFHPGYGMYGFGHPWGGIIMGIIVLAILVALVFALVRNSHGNRNSFSGDKRSDAMAILEERFVRGEIDAATFRSMKSELEMHGKN